jgi:hypothetical protein
MIPVCPPPLGLYNTVPLEILSSEMDSVESSSVIQERVNSGDFLRILPFFIHLLTVKFKKMFLLTIGRGAINAP